MRRTVADRAWLGKIRATRIVSVTALVTVMMQVAGCDTSSGGTETRPDVDSSKVRTMVGFYEGYLHVHRGQPPADEKAFREYLNSKQENLQKAGITVDQMFVSPRDGKPLKWAYGKKPPMMRENGMTCYAYEAEPVAGKHLVFGGRGMAAEINESQFRTLFPNAK